MAPDFWDPMSLKDILDDTDETLLLLVRATDLEEAKRKLWKSLQFHMDFQEFMDRLPRLNFLLGDITKDGFGLSDEETRQVMDECDGILHIAASLNRKSAKSCFNVNLKGTLHALLLAQKLSARGDFRRFSEVSTVAVCRAEAKRNGHRRQECGLGPTRLRSLRPNQKVL